MTQEEINWHVKIDELFQEARESNKVNEIRLADKYERMKHEFDSLEEIWSYLRRYIDLKKES